MARKFVIAQKPNLPIIVWFITWLLLFLPLPSGTAELIKLISFGAIFTWAWLEIFQGINWFRRALGTVVMAIILFF